MRNRIINRRLSVLSALAVFLLAGVCACARIWQRTLSNDKKKKNSKRKVGRCFELVSPLIKKQSKSCVDGSEHTRWKNSSKTETLENYLMHVVTCTTPSDRPTHMFLSFFCPFNVLFTQQGICGLWIDVVAVFSFPNISITSVYNMLVFLPFL